MSVWPQRGVTLLQLHNGPEPIGVLYVLYSVGSYAGLAAVLAAVASLVVRFRRARGTERQQIKWFVYAAVLAVLGFPLLAMGMNMLGNPSELVADVSIAALITPIPVAMGVAILKYRLYDIDRLINRTLVYGLVTVLLAGVYAGLVLVLGQLSGGVADGTPSWVVAGATLTVAALFQPARRRIQAAVDRRFNRRKYDAAKIIESFSARLRDQVDLDTLAGELLIVTDATMEPTTVSLWLRPPDEVSRAHMPRWGY
jgi:hypothetical protein